MAVTSDAMYNMRRAAVQSFVSSNMLRGYVPHCRKENQFAGTFGYGGLTKSPIFSHQSHDVDMEIDDIGYDYSMRSLCLNKGPVVVEVSIEHQLKADEKQFRSAAVHDTNALRRRNRKRCNDDSCPASQMKKCRKGGGKDNIHFDTRSTKDYGSTGVSSKSETLHVNTIDTNMEQFMITNNSSWAAGSHDPLISLNCRQLLSNDGCKLIENDIEYEKILFETHGCSAHQFHRLQLLDNDCIETEF
ncbi:uncharacterized protein LOC108625241 [Ceratina calcarata]|uniref:Uncharacterized protein LOC108625241 n=1 Tax=Ceratina calcarata TaxID=156304 RepID=A0AAJ7IYY9_9HYME|nr:uncharacterized protein LOC108625241 [Ceratina calcarata]